MNSMRFHVRCLATLAILIGVPLCIDQGVNAQSQKIRISLSSRSNTNASYYVAQAKGFFKDEGLEVEFIQINPRLGAMAVLNGDVTFTTSFVSTFRGIVGPADEDGFHSPEKGYVLFDGAPGSHQRHSRSERQKIGRDRGQRRRSHHRPGAAAHERTGPEPGSSDRRWRPLAKVSSGRHRCGAGRFGTTAV